jgi:hypothetical protein
MRSRPVYLLQMSILKFCAFVFIVTTVGIPGQSEALPVGTIVVVDASAGNNGETFAIDPGSGMQSSIADIGDFSGCYRSRWGPSTRRPESNPWTDACR